MKRLLLLLWLGCSAVFGFEQTPLAFEDHPAILVAITPFQINSEEPLEYLSEALPEMLSSRLEAYEDMRTIDHQTLAAAIDRIRIKTLDEATARQVGKETGAAWTIVGSLTKIGDSISLDAQLVDTAGEKATSSVYSQGNNLKGLIEGMGTFAEGIHNKVLGKVVITDISIRGNRLIENDAILYQIKTKVGEAFDMQKLEDDIRSIYRMGYFSDIKVDSVDEPGGKKITFIVKENPEMAEIRIAGNKDLQTKDIQEEIDIKLHTIVNYNKIKDNAQKIKRYYNGKGYYNALVEYSVKPIDEDKATVTFQIVEQHPMKIKKITITGTENLKEKDIKKILENREKNILSFITDAGKFKEEALSKDLERIKAFYYDFGYLDVKVSEPEVTNDAKWIYIKIPVEEGQQYRVSDVKLAGEMIEPPESLMKNVKVTKDQVFSRQKVHDDIMALTDVYGEYGFAFPDITPLTDMNAAEKTVALTYDISQGKKVYFDKITITGNTRTRDKVIRRELRVKEEELYNNKRIQKSRERLDNLGYFEEVKINTKKGSAPDKMDVDVNVKEKQTGMISVGAGYSSVDNLVGMIQVSQNNFFGKGINGTVMAQLGSHMRYRLALTQPYLFDRQLSAGFDAYKMDVEYTDFTEKSLGGEVSLGFNPFGLEDYTLGFAYNYSDVKISDVDADADYEIRAAEGTTQTSSLTSTLSRMTVDNKFYPMRGSLNSFSVQLAGGPLGASEDFWKFIVDSRWYFPFKWQTAFMVRGSGGYALSYGGDDLAVFERFFLGGLDSLRGFEYRSVGPRGTENPDDVVGGDKMMFFNFEYLFPLIKAAKIRGMVFFDAGNAWAKGESIDFDLRTSVGFGVNWLSPFGPLRAAFGINLQPEFDEDSTQFEFSVGSGLGM